MTTFTPLLLACGTWSFSTTVWMSSAPERPTRFVDTGLAVGCTLASLRKGQVYKILVCLYLKPTHPPECVSPYSDHETRFRRWSLGEQNYGDGENDNDNGNDNNNSSNNDDHDNNHQQLSVTP